jgi:hypothetical protein
MAKLAIESPLRDIACRPMGQRERPSRPVDARQRKRIGNPKHRLLTILGELKAKNLRFC